jgi:adenine-specific DNA-methyltransferase
MTPPPVFHSINTILHGDCLTILPKLAADSVNFVLTDPPYVAHYRVRDGREVPTIGASFSWLEPAFAEVHRVLAPDSFAVSFYGWVNADLFTAAYRRAGFRFIGHLAFPKPYVSSTRYMRYRHESAYLLAKGHPVTPKRPIEDVIPWTTYSGNKLHPTQKPLSVLLPLIETFSAPGGLVLDPFAGSGSTLVAAKMLGRAFTGIELDAGYHRIASRRLAETAIKAAA